MSFAAVDNVGGRRGRRDKQGFSLLDKRDYKYAELRENILLSWGRH